jgi:threonylcarbamoyladenosine tRNA methylthiotransferase MtaB
MIYKGKKVAFYTLGCKLNYSETSSIAASLDEMGFTHVGFHERADLYIINSCAVTKQGEKASRNIIRQAVRRNPDAMVIVTGCYAQLKPEEIKTIEGVDLILGTNQKFNIPSSLGDMRKRMKAEIVVSPLRELNEYHSAFSHGERTRSFLKIQDGCDYFCSYCSIPYARGKSRNDSIENTVKEARRAVSEGFKEIVLTGVNIGDFGKSTGENFTDLLKALEKTEGMERLRLGSIEPDLLKDEIIELAASSNKIMPHFHIPLQSGSDKVLENMRRRYNTKLFADRVNRIRDLIPDAFIGVDVIAGTNGETEDLFRESYNFINELDISQLHSFTYSERNGTQALKLPGKVDIKDRKYRTQMYINLSEKKLRNFYLKNLGTEKTVLFESDNHNGEITGFTENYIKAGTPFSQNLINNIRKVKLEAIMPGGHVKVNFI